MSDKTLTFKIDIEGVSTEANELARLEIALKGIKKQRDDLIKMASNRTDLNTKHFVYSLSWVQ